MVVDGGMVLMSWYWPPMRYATMSNHLVKLAPRTLTGVVDLTKEPGEIIKGGLSPAASRLFLWRGGRRTEARRSYKGEFRIRRKMIEIVAASWHMPRRPRYAGEICNLALAFPHPSRIQHNVLAVRAQRAILELLH